MNEFATRIAVKVDDRVSRYLDKRTDRTMVLERQPEDGQHVKLHRRKDSPTLVQIWGSEREGAAGVVTPDGRATVGHKKSIVHVIGQDGQVTERFRLGSPPEKPGYAPLNLAQIEALAESVTMTKNSTMDIFEMDPREVAGRTYRLRRRS